MSVPFKECLSPTARVLSVRMERNNVETGRDLRM
jgi:hypothetical protein